LLDIPTCPVEFFDLGNILFLTSASETGITFVSVILSTLVFLHSNEAL
jgi:hypothetical protein